MNRPKLEEYWSSGLTNHESDYKDFIEDLEKYCDSLEHKLEGHEVLVEKADEMLLIIKELNKALDNACKILEVDSTMLVLTRDDDVYRKKATKEEWKRWCMKDE